MDEFKILGQINPGSATVYEVLYTCPVRSSLSYSIGGATADVMPSVVDKNTQTAVTSIIITEILGGASSFTMALFPTDAPYPTTVAGTSDEHFLFHTYSLVANESVVLSLGLTLSAGNRLAAVSSTINALTITAVGIETT